MNPDVKKSDDSKSDGEWIPVSVTFGSITVNAMQPPESVRRANIKAGQLALQRAKNALITAGIKLPRQKGIPLYFGCDNSPGLMVRELNGKKELGKFVGGRFRVIKQKGNTL